MSLQQKQDELFWDQAGGGYFTAAADAGLLMRLKDDNDNAEPAGNSIAAMNLLRLAAMFDDKSLADKAHRLLSLYGPHISESASLFPTMLAAVDFHLAKPKQIILAGNPGAADTQAMLRTAYAHYLPNRVILCADGDEGQRFLAERVESIKGMSMLDKRATAYVCESFVCKKPTNDLAAFERQISGR